MTETAKDLFIRRALEFDRLMARLQKLRADHFGADPERVTWGDVNSLAYVNDQLCAALEHYGIPAREPRSE